MPHLKLEYTDNVHWKGPIQKIFPKLEKVLIQHTGVKPENCKSRGTQLKDYLCTINDSPGGFTHLEISILSGRSETVKTKIGTEKKVGNDASELLQEMNKIGKKLDDIEWENIL